jgi:hypothetical protein
MGLVENKKDNGRLNIAVLEGYRRLAEYFLLQLK